MATTKKTRSRAAVSRHAKGKGDGFELVVARQFTGWWYPKKYPNNAKGVRADELPFRRTPRSGGWSKKKRDAIGDIMCPSSFPFVVECKNREQWSWAQLFGNNGAVYLDRYWSETVNLVERARRFPLLVFTKNRVPVFVRMNLETWEDYISPACGGNGHAPRVRCIVNGDEHTYIYMQLSDLVATDARRFNLKRTKLDIADTDWSYYAV